MDDYKRSSLWASAFGQANDGFDEQKQSLISAFSDFRDRVSMLVAQIHKDMPSLTVHDISHIDALWWTASEITGKDYKINPAEAFVLGGAFLLHDSAHCIAAYPGGVKEISSLPEWKMQCTKLKLDPSHLETGTSDFQKVLFEVLRNLHPKQAKILAKQSWSTQKEDEKLFLLPHDELRNAYAEVIGLIAESHWHYPHQLEKLNHLKITPPAYIHPAPWTVDVLKLALILRTADASHIDAQRAPRFLKAITSPTGVSLSHWKFQEKINKPTLDPDPIRKEICISGSSFPIEDKDSWWLAYDTARMIDCELRAADRILIDLRREQFSARSVANIHTPENFSRSVPTEGWYPVDTSIKITDINKMVARFGGEKLYGNTPSAALRELIQNSVDAVHACRKLGGLSEEEGEIEIAYESSSYGEWLHITDTGIGMSRYVLTDVLLDFGKSLWQSDDLQGEWQEILTTNFNSIGQFGIGFFSVFMLGDRVKVVTRRYEAKENESPQWVLDFTCGTSGRPTLRIPSSEEKLKRHGTKVSVLLHPGKIEQICKIRQQGTRKRSSISLQEICAMLAPSLDINLYVRIREEARTKIIQANDWLNLPSAELVKRISPTEFDDARQERNSNWENIEPVLGNGGIAIGRLGVFSKSTFLQEGLGVGALNGVSTGSISGVVGVIASEQQFDLARKSSLPKITLRELKVWATKQAEQIAQRGAVSASDSYLLAQFGADHKHLTLGLLGGIEVNSARLIEFCKNSEILIIHEGTISHDDDDDVLFREFCRNYECVDHVLEIEDDIPCSWVNELKGDGVTREEYPILYTIKKTIHEAWGEYIEEDDENALVGTVLGVSIFRPCTTYKRKHK